MPIKIKILIIIFFISTISSCSNKSNEILEAILPNYESFNFKKKIFDSSPKLSPLIIIYRAKMDSTGYQRVIGNQKYVPNCKEFSGATYENMKENAYPFDIFKIKWWSPVYNLEPDFIGHYSFENNKFTECYESRQYKFAYKYLDGYCYLIIENTLQIRTEGNDTD